MKTVRITVEGGVIQHVEVPQGVRVIVWDYDVEGVEECELSVDKSGDRFVESTWEHR